MGISLQIASLFATIEGKDNLTPALKNADKSLSSFTSNLSKQLSDTGKKLTVGLTLPIIGFAATAIKAATDEGKAVAQLNAVIKSTGGIAGVTSKQAQDVAASFDKTSTASRSAILSAEDMLLTFTNINKKVFPQTTQVVLDLAAGMHEDLQTAAVQVGKAMQYPTQGATALQRIGVRLTDTSKKQIAAFEKSGNVMAAQAIILKELQTEFGGSAKAAANADPYAMLNKAFTNLQVTICKLLNSALTPFIVKITDLLNSISNMNPAILQIAIAIGALLAAIGPVMTILGAVGSAIAFLATPIGAIVVAVGLLGAAWATNFLGMRDRVAELGVTLRNAWTTLTQLAQIIEVVVVRALKDASKAAEQLLIILQALSKQAAGGLLGLQTGTNAQGQTTQSYSSGSNPIMDFIISHLGGHAGGGYVASPQVSSLAERGSEYVVPHNGALVSGGGSRGPSMIHIVFQADDFTKHLYVNVADAINTGSIMQAGAN